MKARQVMIGCGIATLVASVPLVLLTVAVYFGGTAFVKFIIGNDLSDYRIAVRGMVIDAEIRDRLLGDLEDVRLSLDEGNDIGFSQWDDIDDSIRDILADGKIGANEYDSLQADIARMKKIQGIIDDKGVEQGNVPDKE